MVAKSELKYLPILGWSWYFSEYVFIKREWERDKKVLGENMKKIIDYPAGYHCSVIKLKLYYLIKCCFRHAFLPGDHLLRRNSIFGGKARPKPGHSSPQRSPRAQASLVTTQQRFFFDRHSNQREKLVNSFSSFIRFEISIEIDRFKSNSCTISTWEFKR